MGEKVLLKVDGAIAEVQLNYPERHNALSRRLSEELLEAAQKLAVARDVRAVIVHGGAAKAFCSGADLKERAELDEAGVVAMVHLLREGVAAFARLPMPVIAAIHGSALGGGCELALACDLRIIAEGATIGLTEVSWSVIPGAGGCVRLPQLVGTAKARELIFTAARLTAPEALSIGLANRVVPEAELLPAARAMADRIAEMGPLAVRAAKRALNGALALDAGLAREWEEYQSIIPTRDRLEGLQAFAEKRKPVFRGE
ncbi:MAG TPA: enoyl-CoA hydratase-related protein [Symbiobacteriaceae bacterium]